MGAAAEQATLLLQCLAALQVLLLPDIRSYLKQEWLLEAVMKERARLLPVCAHEQQFLQTAGAYLLICVSSPSKGHDVFLFRQVFAFFLYSFVMCCVLHSGSDRLLDTLAGTTPAPAW